MSQTPSPSWAGAQAAWPLVGREDELTALVASLGPGRPGAVILGPSGSGRSRLLAEVLDRARAEGAHVEWAIGTRSAAAVPFGALLEFLPGELALGDDPLAVMRACSDALIQRGAGAELVVGIDDADLLDPGSAALILALARSGRVTVLATARIGRDCPDAIVGLYKDAGAIRIELARLDDAHCRALMEAIAGGPVDRAAASRAMADTGGDAVYLRELTQGAIASGALRRSGDLWTIVSAPEPSGALSEIIAAQLAELDTSERELIELIALAEHLSAAEVLELGAAETASRLGVAGLLRDDGALLRLARPLMGQVVAAGLSAPRALALRRRLLTLAASPSPVDDEDRTPAEPRALRLARLRLESGERPEPELLLVASGEALRRGELDEAAELALAATAQERSLAATLALARARRLAGHVSDAAVLLAGVEDLAPGHTEMRAYAAERLGILFWDLRRPGEVSALLDRMGRWSDAEDWRAFIDRLGVTFGGVAEGRGQLTAASRIASDTGLAERPRRMSVAAYRLGLLLSGQGDRAAELAFEQPPEVRAGDDGELAELATFVFIGIETGWQWERLEAQLDRALEQATRARVRAAAGIAALGLARLRLLRGRLHEASRWLMEAEVHLSRRDPFNTMILVRSATVGVAALAGDYPGARLAHAGLQSAVAAREPLANQRPAVLLATARLQALRTPGPAAHQLLTEADGLAGEMPGLAPGLAYEAMRLGDPEAPAAVIRLAGGSRTPLSDAFSQHAEARRARSGSRLLEAAETLARIGASRHACEAAAQAAEAFLAEARQDSARRAAARARELHAAGQGAPPPVVDGLDGSAIELTPREAQLVELARDGMSNAEIADRLVISVRTAETHLYRGMRKLGVRDRRDL